MMKRKATIKTTQIMRRNIKMTTVPKEGMEVSKNTNYNKPERHYEDANDQHVRKVILYAAADDGNLFYDKAKTKGIDKNELFRLFGNGIMVVLDGVYYSPTSYEVSGEAGKITVNADQTSLCFYSKEHA